MRERERATSTVTAWHFSPYLFASKTGSTGFRLSGSAPQEAIWVFVCFLKGRCQVNLFALYLRRTKGIRGLSCDAGSSQLFIRPGNNSFDLKFIRTVRVS